MKRRMATLAIVGSMAVAAMAPATVFAASTTPKVESQTNVYYEKGADSPDPYGRYAISFPANIVFADDGSTNSTQEVSLKKVGTENLPSTLSVEIAVASSNGMTLKNTSQDASAALAYEVTYTGDKVSSTPKIGAGTTAATANTPQVIATFTEDKDIIKGTPDLTGSLTDAKRGVAYTDILTYSATHKAPTDVSTN